MDPPGGTVVRWVHSQADDMDALTFDSGDVVRLESGGPDMTARHTIEGPMGNAHHVAKGAKLGHVVCQWFEGEALREKAFPPESLERVENGPEVTGER